jgi:hypothetical protein
MMICSIIYIEYQYLITMRIFICLFYRRQKSRTLLLSSRAGQWNMCLFYGWAVWKFALTLILLMWRIRWASNSISIYIQQDATLHTLFISGNCSTCFGWYFQPSPGAHTTVSTASGICHTVTTICRYRGRVGTGLSVLWVAYPDAVDTVVCAPDDGWKYHPKHVEQFPTLHLVGYILEYTYDARTHKRYIS